MAKQRGSSFIGLGLKFGFVLITGLMSLAAGGAAPAAKAQNDGPPAGTTWTMFQLMKAAFDHNPNQQGNTETVQAILAGVDALEKNLNGTSLTTVAEGEQTYGKTTGQGPFGNQGWTLEAEAVAQKALLLKGNRAAVLAAHYAALAQQANYDSQNAFIQYTKGALAAATHQDYLLAAQDLFTLDTLAWQQDHLQRLLTVLKDSSEQDLVNSALIQVQSTIRSTTDDLRRQKRQYYADAYVDFPDKVQSIEGAVADLQKTVAPYLGNLAESIATAKKLNKDYLSIFYLYQSAMAQMDADRLSPYSITASVTGLVERFQLPTVVAGKKIYSYMTESSINPTITASYTRAPGLKDQIRSDELNALAGQDRLKSKESDFTNSINGAFANIQGDDGVTADAQKEVAQLQVPVDNFFATYIDQGGASDQLTFEKVQLGIGLISNYVSARDESYAPALANAYNDRYNLAVAIGVLFDAVGYHELDK